MKHLLVVISLSTFLFLSSFYLKDQKQDTDFSCISKEEKKLYELIMQYRKSKGLPEIPLSQSLTIVAKTHCDDLENNYKKSSKCNLHSWSNKSNKWTGCCYTPDHKQAACIWNKPKELTSYKSHGFEIAYWHSEKATPEEALAGWKKSSGHNNTIINKDIWKKTTWKAIGIGIKGKYATVWFGKEPDSEGEPENCD